MPLSQAEHNRRIDYIEFTTTNIAASKTFYSEVFGWEFQDYGPNYTAFRDGRIAGGFEAAKQPSTGGPLVVIYATDLEVLHSAVESAGGTITKATFSFPGGRRFHFSDPGGNHLAVWSDNEPAA